MNHLRLKHWLALGIAAAVLLAGGLAAVLLAGREEPHTPFDPFGTKSEFETGTQTGMAAPGGYELIATIADDTLAPGEEWDMNLEVLQNGEGIPTIHEIVAHLEYAGDAEIVFTLPVQKSHLSSGLSFTAVPYDAPAGPYDLVVICAEVYGMTEPLAEWRLENFLTVLPPAYEDFTVTATLSPNVLEPGASLDGILSIDVRRNAPNISIYPTTPTTGLYSLDWKAEMRQVDGDYRFEVWDANVAHIFSSSTLLRKNAIPADAPEGFYDLVVTMEEYGYEWVFSKILLVWPEGKSLFEGMPAYDDFTCTAEITDDSVTCIRGDAPEITVELTCQGEAYTDFEAYLEFDRPSLSNPYTIPLTFDGERGRAVFQVQFETPLESYTLVVKDTQWGHTWRFPTFVTVEHWAFYTHSEQGDLLLTLALRNSSLGWGDEIEAFCTLDSPEGRLTGFSAYLECKGDYVEYSIPFKDPRDPSADVFMRIPEDAPVGSYDLVVEYDPALAPSEPAFWKKSWQFQDFLTVIDERDTLA